MENEELKDGEAAAEKPLPKPDYDKDPNVQKRKRAAKRSDNAKKGLSIDVDVSAPAEPPVEAEAEPAPELGGEAEGGIVAEAKQEEAIVEEASEEKAEESAPESPAEEMAEGEVHSEEVPAEEPMAPSEDSAPQELAEEDYMAPEGPAHDELIDQYHEALAFGDMETAKTLYKQLQEHRRKENLHRTKSEAQAEQEAKAYVAAATELAAKHPELAEDGLPANKVLALSDVYRQEGLSAEAALKKAVADLYPETPAAVEEPMAPEVMPESPEAPAEEIPEAPAEEAPAEEESMVPDMTERKLQKRNIPAMPSASARNEPAPPPKAPTRSDAIQQMKAKRGQA